MKRTTQRMPDISLLVELTAFYHARISEIVDGERKSEKMNQWHIIAYQKVMAFDIFLLIYYLK